MEIYLSDVYDDLNEGNKTSRYNSRTTNECLGKTNPKDRRLEKSETILLIVLLKELRQHISKMITYGGLAAIVINHDTIPDYSTNIVVLKAVVSEKYQGWYARSCNTLDLGQ
ncbi:hypothetical protein CEXT_426341 [Caerostris extrusa]|uniref:Uncharacterized protein n=1 Tax=Caerostris extrusa TaxID=172846 RepID=A0AAV4SX47_CAEEX|nr:hypothetical protein CEXT_426341 [Caerostris extrusa]